MNNATNIKQSVDNMDINDSRHLWCTYAWTTRNYVVSCLEDLPDAVIGRGWVIHSAYEIADSIKSRFGESASLRLIQILYSIVNLLEDKASALKNGQEIIDMELVDIATIASWAELMHSLNHSWDYKQWLSALTFVFNMMLNQIAARTAEEWALDAKYQEAILNQFKSISDHLMTV